MASITVREAEQQVREFAAAYPTPNVQRAVRLAEAGVISWFDLYDLARRSLATAIEEVRG